MEVDGRALSERIFKIGVVRVGDRFGNSVTGLL